MGWSLPVRIGRREIGRALKSASAALGAPWTAPAPLAAELAGSGITEVAEFASNPGHLRMLVYVPEAAPAPGAPLVVVLHGCGQRAADFAEQGGWLALAESLGVPLVLPEQLEDNNRQTCFNWFRPSDATRGRGEALSIRQMVAEATRRFRSDPARVFVIGLSAGGAMAAALLAAYPDVFAAGAIVAGLPVGCAADAGQAFARMSNAGPEHPAAEWAALARAAAPARWEGPWPRVSIWHGARDRMVDPRNSDNLVAQWTALHGLDPATPSATATLDGARRAVWGAPGRPLVEAWTIPALAHGFPVTGKNTRASLVERSSDLGDLFAQWSGAGLGALGHAFPLAGGGTSWVHDVGIDATQAIARFWDIAR